MLPDRRSPPGETLLERARRTASWLERREHNGWDLFDVREAWLGRLCRELQARGLRGPGWLFRQLEERRPVTLRRILRVAPRRYPKGIALSCQAYCTLDQLDGGGGWAERCSHWLTWLHNNPSPGYRAAWGYPHYWRSEMPIAAHTPSGVVSTACGWAFLDAYRTWGNPEHLQAAVAVAEMLVASLHQLPAPVGLCFSYTPVDRMYCHNANLMTAAYLSDVAALEPRPQWSDLARQACLYTLAHQESDGSFRYFGAPQPKWQQSMVDHFHTGFILRCLKKLRHLLPERIPPALSACYSHYVQNFFAPDHTPRLLIGQTDAIDVHAVAEAALVAADFAAEDGEALARGLAALDCGEQQLGMGDGSYRPARHGRVRRQPIAYVRWGAAWMLLAQSRLAAAWRHQAPVL